ncbi:MAG: hypothetical protein KDD61_14525 [Bdellovibrionales bacterium]|nr:hypothetical protein [Bdellovibrionales bacterium]
MKAIQNVVSLWHQNQPNTPIFGCCYLAEMCNFYFIVQQSPARVKAPLCDLKEFLKPSAPDRFIFFKGQENTDIELLKQKYTLTNEHHEYKSTAYIFEKSSESRPFSQKN